MVDPVLSLVIGAFGAALLSAVAGFIGARINASREHVKWIRAQRLDAYRDYLKTVEYSTQHSEDVQFLHSLEERKTATITLWLLGPKPVETAATTHLARMIAFESAYRFSETNQKLAKDAHSDVELDPELQKREASTRAAMIESRNAFLEAARAALTIPT